MSSDGELFVDELLNEDKSRDKFLKQFAKMSKIWAKKYNINIVPDSWHIDKTNYYDIWNMGEIQPGTVAILADDGTTDYKIGELSFKLDKNYEENENGNMIASEVMSKNERTKLLKKPEVWEE